MNRPRLLDLYCAAGGAAMGYSGGASRKAGVTGDLFNAIPPAYTEFIGTAWLRELAVAA